jgi:hypothetical protein
MSATATMRVMSQPASSADMWNIGRILMRFLGSLTFLNRSSPS